MTWFSFNGYIYLEDDMVRQEAWRKDLNRQQSDASGPPALTTDKRSLNRIASEIRKDWGAKVNFAAKPYLDAMETLDSMSDSYGCDSAQSIVVYFLGNATSWRGETARRIKAELKGML